MFWRMTGLSMASPVDTILDKGNYTLEELLDEDEIIQECKAMNARLINFLRDRVQVELLLRYIVEEAPEDAEKKRIFKFPFIACEIFTCEVDAIIRTLVEDEELINLLFSFLHPDHPHSPSLAGYFSKVVICLLLRKSVALTNYIQGHQEIFYQLVDLIGITSIMEVFIRLIGADESVYSAQMDTWLDGTDIIDMIVDKLSSSESPEVHANAAEILCAITRYAPPGLAAKICSSSFVERLFCHAFEDSQPKSVLVHSLSVCISLLDPKRLISASARLFNSQLSHGSLVTATPETVEGMLGSLDHLLKLLDISLSESFLRTTYGILGPPLRKYRLKIVEFISVLLTIGSEAAEQELIQLQAIKRVLDIFFEYPYNNFLHHHVENIITSCLESKRNSLVEHVLHDCDIIGRILAADKQPTLTTDSDMPTVPVEGRTPPRIGNIGHMTRIANKLVNFGNSSSIIQTHLQENREWADWHANVLVKRNAIENVHQWTCGRPSSLHDRTRDSDEEDIRDRDYDVAALANNLSQAFRYGIYTNDGTEAAKGSLEHDDEDVYFDDETAEVVLQSLRLGDDEGISGFANSNWVAFEDGRTMSDHLTGSAPSPSPSSDDANEVIVDKTSGLSSTPASLHELNVVPDDEASSSRALGNGPAGAPSESAAEATHIEAAVEKPAEWVEWRETLDSGEVVHGDPGPLLADVESEPDEDEQDKVYPVQDEDVGGSAEATTSHEISNRDSIVDLSNESKEPTTTSHKDGGGAKPTVEEGPSDEDHHEREEEEK